MAGYIRQSTFADGDTITSALFNNEYNQILNAFNNLSGHKHDGTTGEGRVISVIGDGGVDTPLNKVLIDSTNDHIEFWIEVSSSSVQQLYIADGAIVPVTDNDIDLGTGSLQFKDLYINGTANIDSLVLATGSTVTAVLDEDDLSSDSATSLVTQQSVKAYIDAQVTAQDLDFVGDSGGARSIDLDSESLTIAGGTGLDTVGSSNTITINIDSTVTTLTGTQTLTNKTLTSATLTTPTLTSSVLNTGVSGSAVLDEDDMSSNSATKLATQQSIKAYVDAQDTAQDLDLVSDSGTISIDLDSELLTVTGGEGIDTSASSNTLTITGEDATTSNKGIASFNSDDFNVSSGAVTLATTSTAAELNILDGATVTTAELNILDGVTSTAAEINLLDGVTSTTAELNILDGVTSTSAELNILDGVTSTAAELNLLDGKAFLDEDNMASNSATGIASQQSIKAYVDSTVAATNEVVEDTTPQLGGDLASNGNDILFAANDKAIFGAGSDLQIYHNGSGSYIDDAGTGPLVIRSNEIQLQKYTGETMASFIADGTVQLRYDNVTKLATTSTGIDVTGTATMDGLTVDGIAEISSTTPTLRFFETDQTDEGTLLRSAGDSFQIAKMLDSGAADGIRLAVDQSSGDISFYEDTGSTAKLFWDASAESLGIGTTSPSYPLHVSSTLGFPVLIERTDSQDAGIRFKDSTTTDADSVRLGARGNDLRIFTGGAETFRIDSSGNVGIGTDNPDEQLHISNATPAVIRLERNDTSISSGNTIGNIEFEHQDSGTEGLCANFAVLADTGVGAGAFVFETGQAGTLTEKVRFTSGGNVGIGTDNPESILHIEGSGVASLRFGNIGASSNSALRISRDDTSITSGNPLGYLEFGGKDSTSNADTAHAYIAGVASGTHAAGDNPTDLIFGTTPDGSSTIEERMRIDSSGNVLVSTTNTAPATNNVEGIVLRNEGHINVSRASGIVGYFNRKTDDGTILSFHKDGTTVGTIGTNSGNIYLSDGVRSLIVDGDTVKAGYSTGGDANGVQDLGSSSVRFKDLYLSGTGYFDTSVGIGSSSNDLGTTAGDQLTPLTLRSDTANTDSLLFTTERLADGSDWQTAAHKIQRKVDATKMGYIQFGSNASDTITFGEASTERMRIDGSGRLGLGTDSPDTKMEIVDADPVLTIRDTETGVASANATLRLAESGGSSTLGAYFDVAMTGQNLTFGHSTDGTADSEQMRLEGSTGRLGIGTNSPLGTLHVNGDIIADANANNGFGFERSGVAYSMLELSATGADELSLYNKLNNDLLFGTNGTERARIDSAGNFGIGTNNPSRELELAAANPRFRITDTDGGYAEISGNSGHLSFAADAGNTQAGTRITFDVDGSEKARIDASGNFGIGTTSLNGKLHIGSANATGDITNPAIQIGGTTGYRLGFYTQDERGVIDCPNGDDGLDFRVKTAGLAMRVLATTGGVLVKGASAFGTTADTANNITMGLTGTNTTGIKFDTASTAVSGNARVYLAENKAGDRLAFSTGAGTEIFSAFHEGNVSIGSTTGTRKLTVLGSSTSQGTIYAYTNEVHTGTDTNAHVSIRSDNASASGDVLHVRGDGTGNLLTVDKSGTKRLVVEAGGDVGIGIDNPTSLLHLSGASPKLRIDNTEETESGIQFRDSAATGSQLAEILYHAGDQALIFKNGSSAERVRIDNSGNFLVGTTSSTIDSSNHGILLSNVGRIKNSVNVAGGGAVTHMYGTAGEFRVKGDGDAENTNNSYGAISDERLKENITDATPKLEKLKQVQIKNYNLKAYPDRKQIGVVAQELEQVFPSLVTDNDDGYKTVKYSVFVPMLIKAMQEQQAIIDDLKTRIEVLEE